MIARQQPAVAWNAIFHAMAEEPLAAAVDLTCAQQVSDDAIETDFSQTNDHAHMRQRGDFFVEPGRAGSNFVRQGLVAGRGAANDGSDPCTDEAHAVAPVTGGGLRGKARAIEQRVEEVSRAVAGEGPASTVRSVRSGSEADEEHARVRVAERRDRFAPVFKITISAALLLGDGGAVLAKALAAGALHHTLVEQDQR